MVYSRDQDPDALEALQAVLEHRPVFFAQDVFTNIDGELRSNSEDVAVEGRVMELRPLTPAMPSCYHAA